MTFESTPAAYSSVNDNLVYVVYDAHAADPVTYPNYKYVADIYINAVKVFTAKVFPNPDTNRGIFNLGSIMREYIEFSFNPTSSVIPAQELGIGSWKQDYVVKIREEYSGTIGAVVLTDSTRTFFNHYNGLINEFTKLDDYANNVASNRPTVINQRFTNNYFFIPYFWDSGTNYGVVITVGATVVTKTITPSATKTITLLNISPGAINAEFPGTILSTTESYLVSIDGYDYTVNLVCPGIHTNYNVHFLNKLGGLESVLFNKSRRLTNEIERKSYQQSGYRVNGSGVVSVKTGDIMHYQKRNFANKFTEKLKISTDWLSDAEYQWLAELIRSPYVLLEIDGTMYPVVVTDNNYEFKEYNVDRLSQLSLNVEFGTSYKTQFS